MGFRSTTVKGLKQLKAPEEDGTEQDLEDFMTVLTDEVTITWTSGGDLGYFLEALEEPEINEPDPLTAAEENNKRKVKEYDRLMDKYHSRKDDLEANISAMYQLIMSNVSSTMRNKIKATIGHLEASKKKDLAWLMSTVDDIVSGYEEGVAPAELALDDALEHIFEMRQKRTESNEQFVKSMLRSIKAYERRGGPFLWTPANEQELKKFMDKAKLDFTAASPNRNAMTQDQEDNARRVQKKAIKERGIAMSILKRANKERFGDLMNELKNDYLKRPGGSPSDAFPKTIGDVLKLLENWQPSSAGVRARGLQIDGTRRSTQRPGANRSPASGTRNPGVSFAQSGEGQAQVCFLRGKNDSFFPAITCRLCKIKGHYQSHCPVTKDDTGAGLGATASEVGKIMGGILLNLHPETYINPFWILLDSESTDHIFSNLSFLDDVKATTDGEGLRLHSSGGFLDTNQKGSFGGFTVWYNPRSLANILSLALVCEQYRVTLDSYAENGFSVHISEGHVMKFMCVSPGLYAYDATSVDMSKLKLAFTFLNTVDDNKTSFNQREIRKADLALMLHRRTNHMAEEKFARVVSDSWIRNCPVTVGDVRRSHKIYGPPLPPIKGRTRYQASQRVQATDIVQIPRSMYEELKDAVLCADFYYVNGVTVFHTITRKIDYRTVSFPISRSKVSIVHELTEVFKIYNARGFRITEIHADNEFGKAAKDVLPARMVCCGVDDHVPEIERSIQTMKNDSRSTCHAMPYRCYPRVMVRALIKTGVAFLNAFGSADRSKMGMSGRNIIENLPHVDHNDLKHEFGEYVQLHVTDKETNTMRSRTVGAIVLDPRNITGRYNFMSLETGKEVHGRVTTTTPITEAVIARVEQLGTEQQQPHRNSKMLKYEWRPGHPIADDDATLADGPAHAVVLIPDPTFVNLPDAGPNPFVPFDVDAPPGAEEDETALTIDQSDHEEEDEGAENEGAEIQGAEAQGAEEEDEGAEIQGAEAQGAENEMEQVETQEVEDQEAPEIEEIVHENDETESDDDSDNGNESLAGEPESENEEDTQAASNVEDKEQRGEHFDIHDGDEYGRGKRTRRPTTKGSFSALQTSTNKKQKKQQSFQRNKKNAQNKRKRTKGQPNPNRRGKKKNKTKRKVSFSFLNKRFDDLKQDEKKAFFECAWKEHLLTGKTHLLERYTTGLAFAQMSAKQGIKKYEKEAEMKLIAEFAQLLEYQVFHGVKAEGPDGISQEEKAGAGDMINLIEEKINRGHTEDNPVLRARSVFNGKVQRGLYTKDETASPTVDQDSLFVTCIVDAIEGRFKVTSDVRGAYLNAKMKDRVIMRISGPEVDFFCDLDPTLKEFVVTVKGKKVLYVQLDRALYGCVKSSVLWYDLYSSTLIDMGFKLNPYDLCVANSDIDGKQCTICWYVDDNKISHVKLEVVQSIISKIEDKFGEMTKTYGEEHDFLGMNIKYVDGKVVISMKKHILKAMDSFLDDINREATSPAKTYLFEVREGADKLNEERADNFHSVTASLLYVSRRCRLDIQTAIGYLCTRVGCSDVDDWVKLKRVLQYLKGTIDLDRIIGGDDIRKMKSWVDVSYGVHDDCKSHTGGCASFGWGVVSTMCKKQTLNVKSSTEGEVVGVSDFLPNMIWTRMFLQEQGFTLDDNTLYQDNQSAMKILLNGKKSAGKKSKHIDNRFYFIKDRLLTEGVDVMYCPTAKMLAGFFTKPLQGSLFRKFRDVIMGLKHIDTLLEDDEAVSAKERVGSNMGDSMESDIGETNPSCINRVTMGKQSWANVVRGKENAASVL